jgi:hypothetical protein
MLHVVIAWAVEFFDVDFASGPGAAGVTASPANPSLSNITII